METASKSVGKKTRTRVTRRDFIQSSALFGMTSLGFSASAERLLSSAAPSRKNQLHDVESLTTNIGSALAVPRTEMSLPGPYPGVVSEIYHSDATEGRKINADVVASMLAAGLKNLTGEVDDREAWQRFFRPGDRVGIKPNPIGGKLHSTAHELTRAVIAKLEEIGISRRDILIWDRYEDHLERAGYTSVNYPGIKCMGVAYVSNEGGRQVWKGKDRLDENVYYEFDVNQEYKAGRQADHQIHTGTKSFFTNILTEMVDKVVNIPVLKAGGPALVSMCLKGLAFGSTSNCNRGHQIINRYIPEVCAFPPIRDKTVLTIIDGLYGCYAGGGGGVPPARFLWNKNTIYVSTDPVAADAVAWDALFQKQVVEGVAKPHDLVTWQREMDFLTRAENLGLGIFRGRTIDHRELSLG